MKGTLLGAVRATGLLLPADATGDSGEAAARDHRLYLWREMENKGVGETEEGGREVRCKAKIKSKIKSQTRNRKRHF